RARPVRRRDGDRPGRGAGRNGGVKLAVGVERVRRCDAADRHARDSGEAAAENVDARPDWTARRAERGDDRRRVAASSAAARATREREGADPRVPVPASVARQVLTEVPERAVVGRVDRDARVVAPTAEAAGLRADAVDQDALAL